MRLLWAGVGVPYSPATGLPIESQIVSQMVDRVLALPEGTRLYLLAPVVRGRKGEYRKELAEYLKKGFQRVKIDGTFYELAEAPTLDKKFPHDIDVVVDRIVVRPDIGQRLAESFETALKLAEGLAVIEYADAPATAGDEKIKFSYGEGVRPNDTKKPFEGAVTNIDRRYRETESEWAREELAKYFSDIPCEACHGYRLKPEALCVKIGGKHIGEISELSVRRAGEWFESVPAALNSQQNEIAARVLKEIRERLSFLLDVGLNYLTLSRAAGTLSGGESQRIRLASQIGSGLTGVLYVLDEPSIGLHQRDNARLLETLKRLRDLGNTVIVVEHDEDAIR